jgi:hypothetical protein
MVGICELCHSSTICDDCKGKIKCSLKCPRPKTEKVTVKGSRDFWKKEGKKAAKAKERIE